MLEGQIRLPRTSQDASKCFVSCNIKALVGNVKNIRNQSEFPRFASYIVGSSSVVLQVFIKSTDEWDLCIQ